MSQSKAKFVALNDKQWNVFTGWLINNSEPWMIPYSNTPNAQNFRVTWRWIETRLWFYQFWQSFAWSDYPRWIWAYYRSNPANDRIVVRYNIDSSTKLVAVNPSDWTQVNITTLTNITSNNRMTFVSGNDSLYCMNWADQMWKLNWTTYSVPSLWITLRPSFWAWFDNCLFVSWDANSPNSIYKSAQNNPESFTWTWSDLFTASYPITWLASAAQTLYIFTDSTIDMINNNSIKQIGSTLVYTSLPLDANEWAVNNWSIAVFWRDIYFLSKSNKIKKISPWQALHYDVTEVSNRASRGITATMDSLDSDQSSSFAYVIPELQIIKWFVKTKWSSFNDICIVYNTEYDEFMIDTNKTFYWWVNYKTQNFTISQIEPKIYQDEYWYTDDDSPIQFRYDTKIMTFTDPTFLKCLWQTRTYLAINSLWEVYQNIYADWALVDSKLINSSSIPLLSWWIWTKAIWTYAIWTDWATSDDLQNTVIIRDKWYLRIKAKEFYVSYVSYALWSRVLLQNLTPQVEQLPFLAYTNRFVDTQSINLWFIQDIYWNNVCNLYWIQITWATLDNNS